MSIKNIQRLASYFAIKVSNQPFFLPKAVRTNLSHYFRILRADADFTKKLSDSSAFKQMCAPKNDDILKGLSPLDRFRK